MIISTSFAKVIRVSNGMNTDDLVDRLNILRYCLYCRERDCTDASASITLLSQKEGWMKEMYGMRGVFMGGYSVEGSRDRNKTRVLSAWNVKGMSKRIAEMADEKDEEVEEGEEGEVYLPEEEVDMEGEWEEVNEDEGEEEVAPRRDHKRGKRGGRGGQSRGKGRGKRR